MNSGLRILSRFLLLGLLAACSNSPRGAPLQADILEESQQENAAFAVVAVNRASLPQIQRWPATGSTLALNWPGKGQSQTSRALRSGDLINLRIWDSQVNSLLAAPEQRSVAMEGLTITPQGTIFVPYIEEVKVAGMTPEAARTDIQTRLTQIAPSAQVQLVVEQGENNMIEAVSGVASPGRYPIGANGVTILSFLAEAGGIPDGLRNPVLRLQRGGKAYATLARDLYRDPSRDIMMRGGDRVAVESDPRSFVVMGATGAEKTVFFEKASHSLLEGISLSSGLQESRVDVRGVMVLRKYPAKALRTDGTGPSSEQTVFTFDLGTGEGLFAARSFRLHADDIVLATESPLPSTATVLGVVGSVLGVAQRVSNF